MAFSTKSIMAESFIYHPMELSIDADATASDILNGKTAVVKGEVIIGTMPNNGTVSLSLNPGTSYTIPRGYHSGSGVITAIDPNAPVVRTASAQFPAFSGTMPNVTSRVPNLVIAVPSGYTILKGWKIDSTTTTVTNLTYTTSWSLGYNSYVHLYADSKTIWSAGNGRGNIADDDKNWTSRSLFWYSHDNSSGAEGVTSLIGVSQIILTGNGTSDTPCFEYYANHNSGRPASECISGTMPRITLTCWFGK